MPAMLELLQIQLVVVGCAKFKLGKHDGQLARQK